MKLICVESETGPFEQAYGDVIRALGHQVSFRADVEEALGIVRTRGVDLALLSDPELVGEVRRLSPNLPIVALGAEDSAVAAARAAAHGAIGYVVIPPAGAAPDPEMADVLAGLIRRAAARLRVEAERRASLEENLRMRKFYGDVLTSVGQGIVVIDQHGKIRFTNPSAARILGESEDELSDQTSAVPVLQMLVESITEAETRHRTIMLERGDQKVFLDVTTSVLRSAAGQPSGAVAIVNDRSIEKSLEQQLFHSERLATLGSLLASIAHEINNTLTSITGCAEMGLELAESADETAAELPDPDSREALRALGVEIRVIFDMVLEAGISCQTIADNMLQYARQGRAEHRQDQDLNDLIERTLKVLGKHLGVEKVTLDLQLDARRPRARIEQSKIQQSLVNLIVNAVQAMLEQETSLEQRRLCIRTIRDDEANLATIAVEDAGPGIPEARLEKIWQPFFTTKGTGTGLGLYITRKVIEDQGGTIVVESAVGEGTTFALQLPLT